ncbi:MAG: 4-hydroxythreonine-4-phosphate dehydrogenase PdxA [Paracoccaceae bacterium]|nr:4-hydroxythreonine-4-phosphate dehydrogenase PdxA [Paracoccaceae bacterium]
MTIVITSGDPSGIGPEVVQKSWTSLKEDKDCNFFWVGDPLHLPNNGIPWQPIKHPEEASEVFSEALPVLVHKFSNSLKVGQPQPENAGDIISIIKKAVNLVVNGKAKALCTSPINKDVLKSGAHFPYPGHTEFLAHLDNIDTPVMMLACPKLKVVPATIHIPLKEVPSSLSIVGLRETIKITNEAMKEKFNTSEPVIAVSGLNPHAGENGQLGCEEKEILIPAIRNLQGSVNIIGPLSADAMFHPAARAKYDVAITMYHDQALIPLKTIGFEEGVNITLGLSFIRTSPDHGTAFDLAGQNIADETSTVNAIKMAVSLSRKCKDG